MTYQRDKVQPPRVQDFEGIVADNEKKIFNAVYSFVGDYEEALDITQETFICAFRAIGKFRQEASVSTWLYRIAINLCKKSHRQRSKQYSIFTNSLSDPETEREILRCASEVQSAIEALEEDEEQLVIRREIYALSRKYRAVIILKYLQDLSYEQIAGILGCSIGTVKSRLSRAKVKLKQRLKQVAELDYVRM